MKTQLNFANDYLQGAHPNILKRMMETNQVEMTGYGTDPITQECPFEHDWTRPVLPPSRSSLSYGRDPIQSNHDR